MVPSDQDAKSVLMQYYSEADIDREKQQIQDSVRQMGFSITEDRF
jgi:hypothetical protein